MEEVDHRTPIRPECLRAAYDFWVRPDGTEIREVLRRAKLSGARAAQLLGLGSAGSRVHLFVNDRRAIAESAAKAKRVIPWLYQPSTSVLPRGSGPVGVTALDHGQNSVTVIDRVAVPVGQPCFDDQPHGLLPPLRHRSAYPTRSRCRAQMLERPPWEPPELLHALDRPVPACDGHAPGIASHRAVHLMPIETNACGAV
jgi:hypothetical protein